MFNTYEKISADTVEALQQDGPFMLNGVQYNAGDYLVKNPDGILTGAFAADFEQAYRKRKKTWSRKKKDNSTEGSEGSEANPVEANVAVAEPTAA